MSKGQVDPGGEHPCSNFMSPHVELVEGGAQGPGQGWHSAAGKQNLEVNAQSMG